MSWDCYIRKWPGLLFYVSAANQRLRVGELVWYRFSVKSTELRVSAEVCPRRSSCRIGAIAHES